MSFIFATRVAIPFDPTSHVPQSFCGWEPWGAHLGEPKGKGPPGAFQRQEALTAPQGPAVTAEPGWSAVTALLTSQSPPLWQFQPPCPWLPGLCLMQRWSSLTDLPMPLPCLSQAGPQQGSHIPYACKPRATAVLQEQKQKLNCTKLWLLCRP